MSQTKKVFVLLVVLSFFTFNPLANAATITLDPSHVSVRVGQAFFILVGVNPEGTKADTAKIDATFSPQVLAFSSWESDPSWTPLYQNGYDSVDNTQGRLVRTGGFTGGFDKQIHFGTVVFTALKTGRGVIALSANSFVYDESGASIYTGSNQVIVDVLPVTPSENIKNPMIAEPAANIVVEHKKLTPALLDVSVDTAAEDSLITTPRLIFILAAGLLLGGGLVGVWEYLQRRRVRAGIGKGNDQQT